MRLQIGGTDSGGALVWEPFSADSCSLGKRPCVLSPHQAPPSPPPRVTFRRVVVPLRGPGQSPVLPFACCVGSLLSVGHCGFGQNVVILILVKRSGRCHFRVRGAQWLVCWGCAGCGRMCPLCASGPPQPPTNSENGRSPWMSIPGLVLGPPMQSQGVTTRYFLGPRPPIQRAPDGPPHVQLRPPEHLRIGSSCQAVASSSAVTLAARTGIKDRAMHGSHTVSRGVQSCAALRQHRKRQDFGVAATWHMFGLRILRSEHLRPVRAAPTH